MIAVSTALAVSLGVSATESLQQVQGDTDRCSFLRKMVPLGYISQSTADATSSFYDAFYTPASTIYCTDWSLVDKKYQKLASCTVRVGSVLVYPVVVPSGWYATGSSTPKRCTKKDATSPTESPSVNEAAAVYYCNLMDFSIGFVHYPSPDMSSSPTPVPTVYKPDSPTTKPTTY